MLLPDNKLTGGVFITFTGDCKKALTFYQTCFGGRLHFEVLDKALQGYTEIPVISGSLISERMVIYGSDLGYPEGRKIGNYLSIFLPCKDAAHRNLLITKLKAGKNHVSHDNEQKLIEITDPFEVRWILGI